ncbi:DUF6484 domain-containing protein [Corallococcus terminator]
MSSHARGKAPRPSTTGPSTTEPILGSRSGWVAGRDGSGTLLVDFEGNPTGPVAARLAVALDADAVRVAVSTRQKAVLLFENGDPGKPFIMGLIHDMPLTPLIDAVLEEQAPAERPPFEARVDGKRVIIEGKDEIVLQCGEASITLRHNGKILVKGKSVETRASGINRIKGGAVEIN